MAGEVIGKPTQCDLERSEGDTDDIVFHFKDSAGASIDTTGFNGTLSIGSDKDTLLVGPTATYTGTGTGVDGLISIDMNGFDVPIGSYKYDLRVVQSALGDMPARVYAKGAFKVTERID